MTVMTWNTVFVLSFGIPLLCNAARPLPEAPYCELLDNVGLLASSQPQTSPVALDVLERVALGRHAEIRAESAAQVGLSLDLLADKWLSTAEVRACALRTIGRTGLLEAVDFLDNLKEADIGTDPSQQIWTASQIALRDARSRRIADPQLKIEFLESTLVDFERPPGPAGIWAANQLCDSGSLGSLPVIQKAFRKAWSGQYGEDEIAFCEARIRVVYGKPDRVKALASVLRVEKAGEDARLTEWAIEQLASMHSREAHAELDRFANEIAKLPAASPGRERFLRFREVIRSIPRASEK